MRISIEPGDSGYQNFAQLHCAPRKVFVTLDGVLQSGVITADSERAMILRFKQDEKGNLIYNADRERWETEVVHDVVKFEIVPLRCL